jgi:NADPH2:quinone reductase
MRENGLWALADDGTGVCAVDDSVAAATFEISRGCLRRRGIVACFGSASGPVPPFDILRLDRIGSLELTGAGFAA